MSFLLFLCIAGRYNICTTWGDCCLSRRGDPANEDESTEDFCAISIIYYNFIFAQRICRWISHLTMMVGGGEGGSVRWRVWVRITGFIREIMAYPLVVCVSIGNQGSHLKLLLYRPIFLETDDQDRWHLTDGRDRSLYSWDHRWRIVARVEWVTRERPKICTIVCNLRTFAIFQFDMIVCWLTPLYLLIVKRWMLSCKSTAYLCYYYLVTEEMDRDSDGLVSVGEW